ncbi:MAG: SDR family oxidoreductase [Proteobacteria bacterium]|nr:SDR family oxidoreductase [Pseudomonadota bacterium]MCP4917592.1 SDR family oxidoreductase [Pseudomonadota bacterium]
MSPPLDGVVIVTGASSGIGEAMARQLTQARVLVLVARRKERLDALAATLSNAEVRPCDLTDLDACEALIAGIEADHGHVDVLINNAGMADLGLFEVAEPDKLTRMIDLNVRALTFLTRRVVPGLIARGRGGILNVSSGYGLTWMPVAAAYVGTKYYVTAFTEALRSELYGTGVVVTQVNPGPVKTELEAIAGTPMGRPMPDWMQLSPEQCARESLQAFRRGRAMSIPGWLGWLMITSGRLSPSWLLRLVYWPVGGYLRAQGPSS